LTKPGDLVLDPFMGGGTTLVEALSHGRKAVGIDVNQLAVFVARAKTTLLSVAEGAQLLRWAEQLDSHTSAEWHRASIAQAHAIDDRVPWPIRKSIHLCMNSGLRLPTRRLRRMARASLLRLGQWALDGRREVPSRREFIARHLDFTRELIAGSHALGTAAMAAFDLPRLATERQRKVVRTSAEYLASSEMRGRMGSAPSLVLTSPPYHGVHIVYHRWQVKGRRETNAPQWLAGARDEHSASFYTFGARAYSEPVRGEYFENALRCFSAIRGVCDEQTTLVQLVGFARPRIQLPIYQDLMREAGFAPILPGDTKPLKAHFTRSVPNRKWYLNTMDRFAASENEFLLIHRIAT
jgi:hypothetical protein